VICFAKRGFEEFAENIREIERKWQKEWKEKKVFEADPRPDKPGFLFTIPYPYTSGPLHIGHGRTYAVGDVFARYFRMKGYNVLFPMAFHITGTPIEAISAKIRRNDPKTWELYKSYVSLYVEDPKEVERIVSKFVEPMEVAKFFSSVISRDFDALGCSIDWRRKFTTGDPEYNAFVSWQFLKLREKGYITQGTYPLLFCPAEGQAVGEDDIMGGDEIAAEVQEFIGIKFRTKDGKVLLASTLRPETIFGVTNVWVHPEGSYVELSLKGERWIVSERAAEKLKLQGWEFEVVRKFKGRELVGLKVKAPNGSEVPVLPALFVDVNNATGIVYSVPAHAPFDYAALMDVKREPEKFGVPRELVETIEPIHIIDVPKYGEFPAKEAVEKRGIRSQEELSKLEEATKEIYKAEFYGGVLVVGPFAGTKISEVKEKVVSWLMKRKDAVPVYEVTAKRLPVRCRCGAEVLVAVLPDQWFLDFNAPGWKEKARKALNRMEIVPEIYRRLFEDTIEWLDKRPCARKRGIGTRLPFDPEWIIESLSDSTIYMAFYTVIHHIRRLKLSKEALKPEFWDYVFLGKGDPEQLSKNIGISAEDLRKMREEFLYWYPLDQRHTMIAHITNHLSFSIFHHVAIFEERHWPRRFTLNEPVIREGVKMSKSKGNVIPLVEVPRHYSADWFRLYMVSAADLSTVLDWREAGVRTVGNSLRRFYELVDQILSKSETSSSEENGILERWIASRMNSAVKEVDEMFSSFRPRDAAIRGFFIALRDMETYIRYGGGNFRLLRDLLDKWIRILAPVIPHLAEEIWHRLGHKDFVSLAPWPEVDEKAIDPEIEIAYQVVEDTIEDANNVLKVLKEKPETLKIIVAPEWKYQVMEDLKQLKPPIDVKDAMSIARNFLKEKGKEARDLVMEFVKAQGAWKNAGREMEMHMLEALRQMIAEKTGVRTVIIERAESTKEERASRALPGKPALVFA